MLLVLVAHGRQEAAALDIEAIAQAESLEPGFLHLRRFVRHHDIGESLEPGIDVGAQRYFRAVYREAFGRAVLSGGSQKAADLRAGRLAQIGVPAIQDHGNVRVEAVGPGGWRRRRSSRGFGCLLCCLLGPIGLRFGVLQAGLQVGNALLVLLLELIDFRPDRREIIGGVGG